MTEHLYPPNKGGVTLLIHVEGCLVMPSIPHWLPDMCPPHSENLAEVKGQSLSQTFQLLVLVTLISIPPASFAG